MRIKKLRLANGYKRFHDLTIDLGEQPARIIALVGPNGSGKSSVLDGILFHASTHQRIGQSGNRDPRYHSMNSSTYDYQNIEIQFLEGTYSDIHSRRHQTGKASTIVSFRSPYRYNALLDVKQISAVQDISLNSYGAGDASSLDAKMEDNYRRLYAYFNRHRDENDLKPSEAKREIIGELNAAVTACLDLEISSIGNIEGNQGSLFFTKLDHPTEFSFNVLSSGEKEVVDLLLDLYLRKQDYSDSIFLIDEPELHINTSIQSKLLKEMDRMVGENCQIWLTTHSIGFLRALQTEFNDKCQIVHFRPEDDLASKAVTLTPIKVSQTKWRELFAVALDDLAQLVSPKTIVYCEGRAEPGMNGRERGFDANVFNTVFSDKYPDVLFTSSGGNTELDQRSGIAIAVLGKVFPTVEILVLKDRDMASGKPTSEADRKTYLDTNPKAHRVLARWEIENYLFDQEVLKSYCKAKSLTFDQSAYNNFVENINDQDLKSAVNRIKNFCGLIHSVGSEEFKLELARYITSDMEVFRELEDCIFKRK